MGAQQCRLRGNSEFREHSLTAVGSVRCSGAVFRGSSCRGLAVVL